MTLEVLSDNAHAIDLYSELGFAPDGFTTMTRKYKGFRREVFFVFSTLKNRRVCDTINLQNQIEKETK